MIRKSLDHDADGVSVKGGVNAVIAANVNEKNSTTRVSSKQRIVQRAGKTTVTEEHSTDEPTSDRKEGN